MPVEMEDQARLVCSGPCLSQTPKINQKTFLLLFTVNFFKQVIYTLLFFLNKNVQTEYLLTEFHSISDDWLIFIFFYDFFCSHVTTGMRYFAIEYLRIYWTKWTESFTIYTSGPPVSPQLISNKNLKIKGLKHSFKVDENHIFFHLRSGWLTCPLPSFAYWT